MSCTNRIVVQQWHSCEPIISVGLNPAHRRLICAMLAFILGCVRSEMPQNPGDNGIESGFGDAFDWVGRRSIAVVVEGNAICFVDIQSGESRQAVRVKEMASVRAAVLLNQSTGSFIVVGQDTPNAKMKLCHYSIITGAREVVAEAEELSAPTLSPDKSQIAWIEGIQASSHTGSNEPGYATRVTVATLPNFGNRQSFSSDIELRTLGPSWLGACGDTKQIIVTGVPDQIRRLDIASSRFSTICTGRFPVAVPGESAFLFIRSDQLMMWKDGDERRIAQLSHINPHFRAMCISMAEKVVVCQDWVDARVEFGLSKKVPGLVRIDLATGRKRPIGQLHVKGPFQIIDANDLALAAE